MNMSADKKYFITASPICSYPNSFIGKTYEQHSDKFDYLFLDASGFTCNFNKTDQLKESLAKWLVFSGPEIFFTIPADERATPDKTRYITRTQVMPADKKGSFVNLIALKPVFQTKASSRSTIKLLQPINLKSLHT